MMDYLMKPLMSQSQRELEISPASGEDVSVMSGESPPSGPGDFDLCFHFVLPSYADASTDESIVQKAQRENEDFLTRIGARRGGELKGYSVQDHAQALFYDVFYSPDDAQNFICGTVRNLKDARTVCIDLILNFFRTAGDAQYFTYMFTSIDHDELFLCVKMLRDSALRHANISDYPLQLAMDHVRSPDGLNIKLEEEEECHRAAIKPAFVLCKQRIFPLLRLHKSEDNTEVREPLLKIDYIRLLYDKVTDVLDIEMMKKYGLLVDYYPLHNKSRLLWFHKEWATLDKWYCLHQPFNEIRDYFGENIALYFVFARHLCEYMVVLCGVSFLMMAVNLVASMGGDFSDEKGVLATFGGYNGLQQMVPAYTLFLIVFTNVFVFHLRQKITYWMNVWGMDCGINSTVKKKLNPRFAALAHMRPSEVDLNLTELGVPYAQKMRGRFYSLIGSFLFICVLLCAVSAFFEVQAAFIANGNTQLAKYVSYGTTIQIKVFRAIWDHLNRVLTDYEHHKDQVDFDMHCALKTQYVSFINCYCSFYYIAFVMQIWGDTSYLGYGSTWQYLTYQMFTTFLVYFIFSCYDLMSPCVTLWRSKRAELQKLKAAGKVPESSQKLCYSFIELQTKMENYDGEQQNGDYMDLIGVFGFVIIFGITNPLCSFFALVYIALQTRVDAWKITHAMRRPYPRASRGDFLWLNIIERYVYMATLTNIGLMCFCWTTFAGYSFTNKLLTFFVLVSIALSLRNVGIYLFSDTSRDVTLARERHVRQRQVASEFNYDSNKTTENDSNYLQGRSNINLDAIPPLCRSDTCGIFVTPPGEHESDDENVSQE